MIKTRFVLGSFSKNSSHENGFYTADGAAGQEGEKKQVESVQNVRNPLAKKTVFTAEFFGSFVGVIRRLRLQLQLEIVFRLKMFIVKYWTENVKKLNLTNKLITAFQKCFKLQINNYCECSIILIIMSPETMSTIAFLSRLLNNKTSLYLIRIATVSIMYFRSISN